VTFSVRGQALDVVHDEEEEEGAEDDVRLTCCGSPTGAFAELSRPAKRGGGGACLACLGVGLTQRYLRLCTGWVDLRGLLQRRDGCVHLLQFQLCPSELSISFRILRIESDGFPVCLDRFWFTSQPVQRGSEQGPAIIIVRILLRQLGKNLACLLVATVVP